MKPNHTLCHLLLSDLARLSGLSFRYSDRLTRDEARQVFAWARQDRTLATAYVGKQDPLHAAARAYGELALYFQADHPQDKAGEPVAWPAIVPAAPTPGNPHGFRPEEAQAWLEWAPTQPDLQQALLDRTTSFTPLMWRRRCRCGRSRTGSPRSVPRLP